jgi:D-alanine transaminase
MIVFFNYNIVDIKDVVISPFDRGFQFSDGIYEVIRYYPKIFFQFDAHVERLKRSLREMEIVSPDLNNLENILYELIDKNGLSNEPSIAYIQITRGAQIPRRHIPDDDMTPTFFIYVERFPIKKKEMANGVKAGLEEDIRWHRCDIKTISLIPNILSKKKAAVSNFHEIIWQRNGIITEGTQTNLFIVKDNNVLTHPLDNNILAGVTRAVVLYLCGQLSITYREQMIKVDELMNADEIFLTSTTSEVMPVVEIDGVSIGRGIPGPITKLLQAHFLELYNKLK